MNDPYKPKTTEGMLMQSEIAILGVIKRLKENARKPEYRDIACDLEVAANAIDFLIRRSDDFK